MVMDYVRHLLSPDNTLFLHDFSETLQPFVRAGLMNSLSQTVIKLTAPAYRIFIRAKRSTLAG